MRGQSIPQEPLPNWPAHDLAHVLAFFERLGLHRAMKPLPTTWVWSIYMFANGFITIALLSILAVSTGVPFVFPSLGPTAYLLFLSPRSEAASPRNTILGHIIGLVCGYCALRILANPMTAGHAGFDWPRVFATALSLAATGALMVLFKAGHPPAGATTMIVSLGIISEPKYLVVILVAVFILTAQAWVINRLAGLPMPLWRVRPASELLPRA